MDAGTMAGLGAAFTVGGNDLNTMAQDQFKGQIDAANRAQRMALATQAQTAAAERQKSGETFTASQDQKKMDQSASQFDRRQKDTEANNTNEQTNRDANTKAHQSEVASNVAKNTEMTKDLLPAETAHYKAMAEATGSDHPAGVTKAMLAAAKFDAEQQNKALEATQSRVRDTAGDYAKGGGENTPAARAAAIAADKTQQKLTDAANKRYYDLSGLPPPAASQDGLLPPGTKAPAKGAAASGTPVTRTDTTGKVWTLNPQTNQWMPPNG